MANTINDLYLKYVNKVGATLEKDRYFQYLFEIVQAGNNELKQKRQVLHKVVDEQWLGTIEDSLDAINNIIEKPRRFITTKEEVVPVSLARKITADSVRHLSMNTQFIASNEDGDIQPTRILNVSTEESYDLYENRFIYHLIQRLVTFIDKRTDVIFWSTGDETKNVLSYESKVDDAYEEIEYKIEMSVKNTQSFAENDSDNMQVFMRIDRVRRLVMALRKSAFCEIMAGCAKVHSPIQRTNLMMKDPDYRTCYKLWQFLERYDEVGYSIDVQESTMEFDEEYLFQLYTNLITNYTVFKSLLDDKRNLTELSAKHRKPIKPKFIKKIEEQIVDDYNIPEVEVRQVIIEEVTQAQLDAEAALAEKTEELQNAEEALEELEGQMMALQQQLMSVMQMSTDAQDQLEIEQQEKEELLAQMDELTKEKEAAEAEIAHAQAEAADAKEQAAAQVEAAQAEAAAKIEATQAEAAVKIETTQAEAAAKEEAANAQLAAAQAEIEAIRQETEKEKTEAKAEVEAMKRRTSEEMTAVREQAEQRMAKAKEEAEAQIAAARQETDAEIAASKAAAQAEITAMQETANAQVEKTKAEAKAAIEAAHMETAAEKKARQTEVEAERQARQAEVSKVKADAKAEVEAEKQARQAEVTKVKADAKAELEQAKADAEAELAKTKEAGEAQVADAKAKAEAEIKDAKAKAEAEIKDIQAKADTEVKQAKAAQKQAENTASAEARARAKAEAKADGNSLSKYIITALQNRKKTDNTTGRTEQNQTEHKQDDEKNGNE
jgi:hypothetical protein